MSLEFHISGTQNNQTNKQLHSPSPILYLQHKGRLEEPVKSSLTMDAYWLVTGGQSGCDCQGLEERVLDWEPLRAGSSNPVWALYLRVEAHRGKSHMLSSSEASWSLPRTCSEEARLCTRGKAACWPRAWSHLPRPLGQVSFQKRRPPR